MRRGKFYKEARNVEQMPSVAEMSKTRTGQWNLLGGIMPGAAPGAIKFPPPPVPDAAIPRLPQELLQERGLPSNMAELRYVSNRAAPPLMSGLSYTPNSGVSSRAAYATTVTMPAVTQAPPSMTYTPYSGPSTGYAPREGVQRPVRAHSEAHLPQNVRTAPTPPVHQPPHVLAHAPGPPLSSAAHAAAHAPPGFLRRNAGKALGAAGLAAGAYAMYRGGRASAEQDARMRDYVANAGHNASTPLPPMAVHASYDEFANEKMAEYQPVYPTVHNAIANSLATQLATKFVGQPLDKVHEELKKKFYDEPKQRSAFEQAVQDDEILSGAHQENPQSLQEAFSTLRTFAPSLAKHPASTRSFLRNAVMSGSHRSGIDFVTIKNLAETEKHIQHAKGRGVLGG